jgi:hypothetical protein
VKIDGRCHCGFITYNAEAKPEDARDLSLHGLPEPLGLGVPHGYSRRRHVSAALGRAGDLRQDR